MNIPLNNSSMSFNHIISALFLACSLSSCAYQNANALGSGHDRVSGTTLSIPSGISTIANHTTADIIYTQGNSNRMRFLCDESELKNFVVTTDNATLTIRSGNNNTTHATIIVESPDINVFTSYATGDIMIESIKGSTFCGRIYGTGSLTCTYANVNTISLGVYGTGEISLASSAKADAISLELYGTGDINLGKAEASSANVICAGTGNITLSDLNVETATFNASGTGDITASGVSAGRLQLIASGTGGITVGGTAGYVSSVISGLGDINISGLNSIRSKKIDTKRTRDKSEEYADDIYR